MGSTVYFEDEHYYNRLLVAFPDGKILHYDKKHLFTMGEEKEHFTAGNELLVFDYQGVRIAPFICYDLRFYHPERPPANGCSNARLRNKRSIP